LWPRLGRTGANGTAKGHDPVAMEEVREAVIGEIQAGMRDARHTGDFLVPERLRGRAQRRLSRSS